jgi:hypothetical protein
MGEQLHRVGAQDADRRGPGATRPLALCVASSGGHLVQMRNLLPALRDYEVVLAGTTAGGQDPEAGGVNLVLPDANRWSRVRLIWSAAKILVLTWRLRPALVLSTGAAPGYFALRFGRWFGARTIWVDSLANVDSISMAGRLAASHADLVLTQWEHLEGESGAKYAGSIL